MRKSWLIGLSCLVFLAQEARSQVEPLIQTAWCQTAPYNADCPEGTLAGCVAIAMAQVMNYHHYPPHGTGKSCYVWHGKMLSANYAETWYRWEDMEHTSPSASQLIYQCGVSVWMDYSTSFSGSSEYYALSALKDYFGYHQEARLVARNQYSDEEWASLLRDNLDKGWPIIYSSGGHTFIVDGYLGNNSFHANMGYGWVGSNRYYSVEELGGKSNSTAIINLHPGTPQAEHGTMVVYHTDATSDHYAMNEISEMSTEAEGSLRLRMKDLSSFDHPISGISYIKMY